MKKFLIPLCLFTIILATALADTPPQILHFTKSLVNTSTNVSLVNDATSPGNSKYYGTDSGGTRGYFTLPNSAVWGQITGTLSNQTDLQSALDSKVSLTGSQTVAGVKTFSSVVNADAGLDRSTGGTLDIGASSGTNVRIGNASAALIIRPDIIGFTSPTAFTYTAGSSFNFAANKLSNLADPTSAQDAATKNYVDVQSGNAISALTGDVTASGPGSAVATLATVNTNTGSFGSSTSIPNFTVNGKGLITAAGGNAVIAPAGTLTGTTLNSTVVTSSLTSLGAQASALNMNSHLINNLTDPSSAQDAATKNYVDVGLAGKQPTGNYITALTGDATASGPGSVALTLATVNSNVGSFGSATQASTFTVNGKGLLTAAGQTTVTPAVGSITGLGTGIATFLATPSSANLASAVTDETGSSLLVFNTSPTLVTPAITTSSTLTNNLAANTSGDGFLLTNTAVASVGNQSFSPRVHLIGQGWKTTATAASQTADWIMENQPVQGTTNPTSNLVFSSQINGAGYNTAFYGTSSGSVLTPLSGALALGIAVTGQNTVGIGRDSSVPGLGFYGDGTEKMLLTGSSLIYDAAISIGWSATTTTQNRDLILSRSAAATLQQGAANAASPVAQTLQSQGSRAGTDTNVGGSSYTIQSGQGTGTGTASSLIFKTPVLVASGTGAQTMTTAMTLNNGNINNTQSIGATSTDGFSLSNTTAAAAGAQQWSPRVHLTGQGWKTNATAASQTIDWIMENQPIQGTGNPSTNLVFSSQINGGGYLPKLSITSSGILNINNGASSTITPVFNGDLVFGNTNGSYNLFSDLNDNLVVVRSGGAYAWANSTTTITNATDTFLSRPAAATIQQGQANAASPVNQTLQAQGSRAGTDSNIGGANYTHSSGIGTGTGTLSSLILQSPIAVASGTGAQTATTGLTIKNGTAVLTSYIVSALPSASVSGSGALAFVTDANTTAILCLGTTVVGGGSNKVPVFSDGTNWICL